MTAPGRSLLLWGGTDAAGTPFLEPAFVVTAPPSPPSYRGEWTLEGRADDGTVLFRFPVAMSTTADGGEGTGGFIFTLPAQPGWDTLARITLSGPGGVADLDTSNDRPVTIWRDGNGRVRAILREELAQAHDRQGWQTLFSRGIPAPRCVRWVG